MISLLYVHYNQVYLCRPVSDLVCLFLQGAHKAVAITLHGYGFTGDFNVAVLGYFQQFTNSLADSRETAVLGL